MQSQNPYLENEVKSATPQRLRVLLIDGAIRFALLAQQHLDRGEDALAAAARGRCRAILAELLDSITGESEVSDTMRAVYTLTLTQFVTDEAKDPRQAIENLVEVLKVERETWQLVCEQLPEVPPEIRMGQSQTADLTSADAASILMESGDDEIALDPAIEERGTGFCLDA